MTCYDLYFKDSFCLFCGTYCRGLGKCREASEEAAGTVSSKSSDGLGQVRAVELVRGVGFSLVLKVELT